MNMSSAQAVKYFNILITSFYMFAEYYTCTTFMSVKNRSDALQALFKGFYIILSQTKFLLNRSLLKIKYLRNHLKQGIWIKPS